jgi:hypothetical protein
MKRRATSFLLAIATGGPVAAATYDAGEPMPTAVTATPRVLASGAPACGNVATWKLPMVPGCEGEIASRPLTHETQHRPES